MGPRKSASEWSNEMGYPAFLQKLCKEEDVLIIPQFLTVLVGRQAERVSPRKSKDSKVGDRFGSSSAFASVDSRGEDTLICGNVQPPHVGIVYENPEDKDTPVTVICKGIYIEFALISAIGKSLSSYPTISCLKIEKCCVSKEIVEALALLLAEESGKSISEVSFDGNEDLAEVLPLFLRAPTNVKYLSLQRCSLDDEAVRNFAESLCFSDDIEQKLQVLNLSMNKIGNAGLSFLADALRTNRSLTSLSLAGNQIGDEGAERLAQVLQKFPLTLDEVMLRRKRIFQMVCRKKTAVEKYIEEWKLKEELEASRTSLKTGLGRRIRGPDGKIRCLSSRDKKNKAGKINSGEKFRGRTRNGGAETFSGTELPSSEIVALVQQVESEILPDRHPFVNEVLLTEGRLWCTGCWSLANVNLAFNYLTEKSLEKFTEALHSQGENFGGKPGLLRLVVLPGNSLHENLPEFQKLQSALIHRSQKKEAPENVDLPSSVSISNGKRLSSSSGKWGKNR